MMFKLTLLATLGMQGFADTGVAATGDVVDECQKMFEKISSEEAGDTKKEDPSVAALFDDLIKCTQTLTALSGKVTEKMQHAQESNIQYMRDYVDVYSTLEYLKGPQMLEAFQKGHRDASNKYQAEVNEAMQDLKKLQPYTEYNAGEVPEWYQEGPDGKPKEEDISKFLGEQAEDAKKAGVFEKIPTEEQYKKMKESKQKEAKIVAANEHNKEVPSLLPKQEGGEEVSTGAQTNAQTQ